MKRIKMQFSDLESVGEYYDFWRGQIDGVKGYFYKLERKLTDVNKNFILSYKNTKLFYSRAQYAPEQVSNIIFIGDKCF